MVRMSSFSQRKDALISQLIFPIKRHRYSRSRLLCWCWSLLCFAAVQNVHNPTVRIILAVPPEQLELHFVVTKPTDDAFVGVVPKE